MATAVSTYAFLNAKLRARMAKLLPRETITRMVHAHSLEEALHLLRNTSFASVLTAYEQTGDLLTAELEIQRLQQQDLFDVKRYAAQFTDSVVTEFLSILLSRFEISDIKNAIRLWFERAIRGRMVEDKLPYLVRSSFTGGATVESIVNASTPAELGAVLESTPYGAVLSSVLPSIKESGSLFSVEVALDRWYFQALQHGVLSLKKRDRKVAERMIGIEIDVVNVNWVTRMVEPGQEGSFGKPVLLSGGYMLDSSALTAATESGRGTQDLADFFQTRFGLPGLSGTAEDGYADNRTRSAALLESMLQQALLVESRRALAGNPFTIGIPLAYVALKQQETRTVTTVLNGKYYAASEADIGAFL